MINLAKFKIKLTKAGLDDNQIEQLNAEQLPEKTINELCAFLEKTNYKFIKKHNEKVW